MATVKYTDYYENRDADSHYQVGYPIALIAEEDGKSGQFYDSIYLSYIDLTGKNLAEGTGAEENTFISGTVTKLEFGSYSTIYMTVTGSSFKATALSDAAHEGGYAGLIKSVFAGSDNFVGSDVGDNLMGYAGKDIIKGKDGGDNIDGGKGAGDKLFGGGDSDYFILAKGNSSDFVADFDFQGKDHDWIHIDEDISFKIATNADKDVVISTDHGSLTLLGVSKNEFKASFVTENYAEPDVML